MNNLKEQFQILRESIDSVDNLESLILENQTLFWKAAQTTSKKWSVDSSWKRVGKDLPMPELLEVKIYHIKWSEKVYNTHSSPIDGCNNFLMSNDKPKWYPGWTGRIKWTCKWPLKFSGIYLGSTLLNSKWSGLYNGSGGGGQIPFTDIQSHEYDLTIFGADWPNIYQKEINKQYVIRENYKRRTAWRAIGGRAKPPMIDSVPHDYQYPDPLNFKWHDED